MCFVLVGIAQQPITVKLTRPHKFMGNGSKISLLYQGEEKTKLLDNSSYVLNGTLPADSIIELSFKMPMERAQRFFLYPNPTFNYDLVLTFGKLGVIKVKDNSVYAIPPVDSTAKKGILPKGVSINKRTLGVSYINEKTLNSDKIRDQWTRVGGKIVGKSFSYNMSYAGMTIKDPSFTTKTTIVGGGYVLTQNYYNLKIPEYKPGIAPWTSFVYGLGLSVNLHMSNIMIDNKPPAKDMEFSSGALVFMWSGNVGYTLGLGKFKTLTEYKGFAFDLTYRPSVIATVGEGGSQFQLNMKGFGVDVSRTSFSAFANSLAPRAKSRFSFFFLPPIKNTPLMISLGYGLVWYR
jgi:hypothetical protein